MRYSGFIINYVCNAKCRHCAFAGAPLGGQDFASYESACRIASKLAAHGVTALHIGGGEPFLRFDALCGVIRALTEHGIAIDYIETNAFWCTQKALVKERLQTLRALGANTLMVSVDPFHVEYVPLARPLLLCQVLDELGMEYFIWQERFIKQLMSLDPARTHSHEELQRALGADYILQTAREYGIGLHGRALQIAPQLYPPKPAVLVASAQPCAGMLNGTHCHADLYGKIIPAGCPGISIDIEDFFTPRGRVRDAQAYPIVQRLLAGGTAALLRYGCQWGFDPQTPCSTNCDLCYRLRRFLLKRKPSRDIAPACFYRMMEC